MRSITSNIYHSDHLGSASLISDYKGDEYQRIEYAPYGETWVEKTQNTGLEYLPYRFTGKEMDEETGFYYYGARYLDPKYSRWISTDPALGEYIPQAPISDEARKHNQNLPGMGGIYNTINSNLYHYAGNNPVKYTDPTGNEVAAATAIGITFVALATYYTLVNYYQNPEVQEANRQLAEAAALGIETAKQKIKNAFSKSKNKNASESKPAEEPSALPKEGVESGKGGYTPPSKRTSWSSRCKTCKTKDSKARWKVWKKKTMERF